MIAPSTRHVPLVLGVAALLLLPVLRNGLAVQRREDCARPDGLLSIAQVAGSGRAVERYEKYDEDLRQWTEVELRPAQRGTELRGALIRSFRPLNLYTRPPSNLLGPIESGERDVEFVEVDGHLLPIQTIFDSSRNRNTMASYLFVYGGKPVEHPLVAQLGSVVDQVWHGTWPLSLLIVAGPVDPSKNEVAREQARRWLVGAYSHYRTACTL